MSVRMQPSVFLFAGRYAGGGRVQARRHRGFTLVELMVTVAVAAVLLMIAVPSFRSITASNRLNVAANDLIRAIQVARTEAVKRNSSTQLCSNSASANTSDTLGAACGTQTGAVWALTGDQVSQVLADAPGIAAPVQISGTVTALRFTAQGLAQKAGTTKPYGATVADLCTSQISQNNHRVIAMTAGSILATTTTSGDCP